MSNRHVEFIKACKRGDLAFAKKMYASDEYYYSHMYIQNNIFRSTCEHGHLDVAQWLLSVFGDEINITEDDFNIACYNGYLEIAQWLMSLTIPGQKIDPSNENNCAFSCACCNGNISVTKWLKEIMEENVKIDVFKNKSLYYITDENMIQLMNSFLLNLANEI